MYRGIPDIIKQGARNLRKNATRSEKELWRYLKGNQLGVKILRQKPIYVYTENSGLERFVIADFYCHEAKIIIELDGLVHNQPEVLLLDLEKEKLLKNLGYKILRFTNDSIDTNIMEVVSVIKKSFPNSREGARRADGL